MPLLALPSAIWRTSHLFHGDAPRFLADGGWYLLLLSLLTLGLGGATVVLVVPWGAWCPPWLPQAGGSLLVLMSSYATWNSVFGPVVDISPAIMSGERFTAPGWDVMALYVPMLLWGPLLILVALDYRRRRRLPWLPSPAR